MQKLPETITVNRVYAEVKKRKSQEVFSDEDRKVEVRTFEGIPTATVSFRAGLTKNLGSYNSANVNVAITVPTYMEEIPEAIQHAQEMVDVALAPALEEFVDLLKSKGLLGKE
jgi:hypothetical protein